MKKSILSFIILFTVIITAQSKEKEPIQKDTLYTELKTDIVILSSTKETNSLKSLPAAVSVFSPKNLEALQVQSLKDLSAIVPNYFAADYGSKMTAPLYIRGIGARSGFQTVSMYVDNIPYFNTTSFDTELFDIQRIEVLRGTQGTLYGRNAMGGILNVYTYSPLTYEGTTIKVGGGNHGQLSAGVSDYRRINKTMGISVSAYYKRNDGYFTNKFDGKKIDDMDNAGGRVKYVWDITPGFTATLSSSLDYVDQGAFPYRNMATDEINYNSDGYYKRLSSTNGLSLRYTTDKYEINSTTGYQYLNDRMNMDQDYTPLSMFQINQRQRQNSISQEITIKSNNTSRYRWSNGVFGFYDRLTTTPPVYMMKDGVQNILQKNLDDMFDRIKPTLPPPVAANIPKITFEDDQIDLDGKYKRPTYGFAIFHQSTLDNVLIEGLSITGGVRLDYEKTKLKYNANTATTIGIRPATLPPHVPTPTMLVDTAIIGSASDDFLEFLPKAVIKYQINKTSHIYASASRGYKTGGHNIQMFADLLQEALQAKMMGLMPISLQGMPVADNTPVNERISYDPEYSWNYEVGGQFNFLDNALSANVALFYMDVKDVQLTQFVKSGGGRMVTNGGRATSKGFEVGLKTRPCTGFYLYANYGFVDAKFDDYVTTGVDASGQKVPIDYSGNYIPFAPRSTFSVGANIEYILKKCPFLDKIMFDTYYAGVGKTYWDESNAMAQGFYGTLNSRLAFEKKNFTLEFWGRNILDREYDTFLFESSKNHFAQQGKPIRWGASLKIKL